MNPPSGISVFVAVLKLSPTAQRSLEQGPCQPLQAQIPQVVAFRHHNDWEIPMRRCHSDLRGTAVAVSKTKGKKWKPRSQRAKHREKL